MCWNKKMSRTGFAFFTFIFFMMMCANGAERPEITIPRTDLPPLIDGALDDKCWEKAVHFPDFLVFRGGGKTTEAVKTRAVFDDEWLYFAFEIQHPHPDNIDVTPLAPDTSLAQYDSVEVFFDPGTGGETYFHYMLSAANARAERRGVGSGRNIDTTWKMPWRSAAKITETGWQAEMAIPLAVVAEYGDITSPTMLIGANRIIPSFDNAGALYATSRETSSWVPAPRGFHHPPSFGVVRGLEEVKPAKPFLVSAVSINTSGYQADEGGFFYEVSGIVQSHTGREGETLVVIEDSPAAGPGLVVSEKIELAGLDNVPFTMRVPVKAFSDRTAYLTLRDPATDEDLLLVPLRDLAGMSLMRSYIRYSYYTTESEAQIVCELGLPGEVLREMKLVAKDAAGSVIAETDALSSKTFFPVPITELDTGAHSWTVELQRENGEIAVSQEVEIVKREPKPGCEWKIDHGKGRILNNGAPFFPFGIMAMFSTDEEGMERDAMDLADMGFNSVVRWAGRTIEHSEQLLEMAEKYGFYVIDFPGKWTYTPPEGEEDPRKGIEDDDERWNWSLTNVFLQGVKRTMDHPRMMAWYLWDEPQSNLRAAELIGRLNNAIYAIDGYRPTEVLYIPPIPTGDLFSKNCDILGIDPYWVPGAGAGNELGNPNRVGRHTWLGRQRADQDRKLLWVTPVASRWSRTRMRLLNVNEQRVQTYLSLIHGAQGLLYFVYPFRGQVTYDAFKQLGAEMKILGPACAAGTVPQIARYTPVPLDPFNNVYPDIQASLKRNPDGGYILLAANWRPYPVEASYTVSLLGKSGTVRHIFDGMPEFQVADSTFRDTIEPMSTRAYAIPGPHDLKEPVEIAIDLNAVREKTDAFYAKVALPEGGAPGSKNLLRNSSFEEVSIPGFPDYYFDFRGTGGLRIGGDHRGDPGMGVCNEYAFHGKNSVRLTGKGGRAMMLFQLEPDVTEPTPFIISAWVRGDVSPGTTLRFYGPFSRTLEACDYTHIERADGHNEPVTGEWTRIWAAGVTPPPPLSEWRRLFGFWFNTPEGATNTVWIDAVQFELGTELTDYEP